MGLPLPLLLVIKIINATEKAQIAAEIMAFKNTDFSDCTELTNEQLAQMKPPHLLLNSRIYDKS